MTPDQLLLKRYLVTHISVYGPPEWGDIIQSESVSINPIFIPGAYTTDGLKELQWWEYRKIGDLPEYVKSINSTYAISLCYKVKEYLTTGCICTNGNALHFELDALFPATKQQYEDYIKRRKEGKERDDIMMQGYSKWYKAVNGDKKDHVPLTEQWLIDNGFKFAHGDCYQKVYVPIDKEGNTFLWMLSVAPDGKVRLKETGMQLEYVHDLLWEYCQIQHKHKL